MSVAQVRRAAVAGDGWLIRLECTEGKHNKFWQAEGIGTKGNVRVSWGRIGTAGQELTKDYHYMIEKTRSKLAKGYVIDHIDHWPVAPVAPPKKKKAPPKKKAKPVDPVEPVVEAPKPLTLRDRMAARRKASDW